MKNLLPLALFGISCLAVSAAEDVPTPYFMADFNTEETMTKATIGKDMEFINVGWNGDTYSPIAFMSDGKGVNKEDGYVYVPTGACIKCDFSALPGFVNPADPDNPYVGVYSFAIDVKVPKLGTYYCLFNSNPKNNTDAKLCLNGSGNIGSGFLKGYDDSWAAVPDTWYRITFTANQPDGHFAIYADGNLIQEGESGNVSKIDGRYALEKEGTLFIADDNEEDAPMYCSKIMFFDKALTAAEVKALGGPKTEVTSGVASIAADDNVAVSVDGGVVNVSVNGGKIADVAVYSLTGVKVAGAVVSDSFSWDSADAATGVYVVRVASEGNVSATKVIVK
jgi:hypothetical protein